ncbi:exodeoxyribonuclease VII small subunit [Pseudovibrio exalbescens]|uniref:Exodeoxyribonuclease 7 small subunit n=1 Tax=Pseudovibrio exalbescens TaxID=197461 RepID=A0A1U7JD00_9HYPH|nr:exodeoxyribonuclease VII small subunit [Pseudovibrio exalbescens]OKL42578.1 exodeoxyribonuclease VII small subunit [Pseudovibrio exalbescens]
MTTGETEQATIESLSFESALAQLETIVRDLEQGNVPLEKSIELYSRGEALRKHCDSLLKAAEAKVEKIQLDTTGNPTGVEPLGD